MRRLKTLVSLLLVFVLAAAPFCGGLVSFAEGEPYVLGDLTGDGKVKSADARIALRIAARLETAEKDLPRFKAADVDGDGKIRSSDARTILRVAAKLETFPQIGGSGEKTSESGTVPTTFARPEEDRPTAEMTTSAPRQTAPETTQANVTAVLFPTIVEISYPDEPPLPQAPSFDASPDTFVFITYGHGHGVGLSQYGAIGLARHGYDHASILAHYYPGAGFVRDSSPHSVSTLHTGETTDTFELLCRVVQSEIGGLIRDGDEEAMKAQAIVAYTQLKYHDHKLPNQYTMSYGFEFSRVRQEAIDAVTEVYGVYLAYNGRPIAAPFGAYSAGVTASALSVWGVDYPYLRSVTSYYDRDVRAYSGYTDLIDITSFSSEQIEEYIKNYDSSISLGEDPATWLRVLSHDKAVSPSVGYITSMRIGDRVFSERDRAGEALRLNIMDLAIRSHCFSLVYYDKDLVPHDCGAVME